MYQNINKIYHAAIYVRLSKEDGDISSSAKLESNSISNQKALILDFLKDKKDIEVVSVRVDDGYSGSNFERPAFQAMLEDIRRGIVDCVVVKDLSRFGREYIDSGKYIERLFPALGVRFIAINDNYDSLKGKNQADEIIIPFKNLINDAYCRDISIKIRSNLEIKRKKGECVTPFVAFLHQYLRNTFLRKNMGVQYTYPFLLNLKSCCSFQIQKADLCLGSCLLRLYPAGIRPQLLAEKFRHEKKPQ